MIHGNASVSQSFDPRRTRPTDRFPLSILFGADTLNEPTMSGLYRIAHISDLHLWRFTWNPLLWLGKRALGLGNLALRRGRNFRREALPSLLSVIETDGIDHLLVSG